jgi:predicted negative regulator of RcsB-dependent stress response
MLAACLLFGWTTSAQAATTDEAELSALYSAIFTDSDQDPADDADADVDALENIWCCVPANAACVSTTKDKCLKKVTEDGYEGTVHATYLACTQAGCK